MQATTSLNGKGDSHHYLNFPIRSFMTFPELAATNSQPHSEQFAVLASPSTAPGAPQSWMVSVANAKFHWYDLVAGFQ